MSDKDITLELIHELGKMSISELEGFWPIWNAEPEGLGVGEYAKNFCKTTNDLIKINYDTEQPTVSARDLHEGLGIGTKFNDWFPRMAGYGFVEGADYILVTQKRETNNPKNPATEFIDYNITVDMAKQICMIQRSEKGKEYRQYFLDLEKAWNTPEQGINGIHECP